MQRVGSQEETAPHTQELIVKQIMFLCQLLDKEQIEEIQKLIYKALWRERNSVDAIMEGRHKISKERTHTPVRVGGLTMRITKIKASILRLWSKTYKEILQ